MTRTVSKPCSTIRKAYHRGEETPAAELRGSSDAVAAIDRLAGELRESDRERAPALRPAVDRDRSSHRPDELIDDEQPEPGAAGLHRVGVFEAAELLEDLPLLVRRDPTPDVAHREDGMLAVPLDAHHDRRVRRREFHRVVEQVGEHLPDADPVA